jgi:hypothetical protein
VEGHHDVLQRIPWHIADSLRSSLPQKKRILVLSVSKARKPLATFFSDWITRLKPSPEALVILCRIYVRRLGRCFVSILATLTTGVSWHRAPQAFQRRNKVAALSV